MSAWNNGNPTEAGWYSVMAHGKAYWNGKKWLSKNKGKEIRKKVLTAWKPIQYKLTPWFPADVKPVRKGWYDRDWDMLFITNDYWDGKNWFNGGKNNGKSSYPSSVPRKWRGILK